jgi:hypothetical protein
MRASVFVVAIALLTSGCEVALMHALGDRCSYTTDLEATVSATGVSRVRVVARAGSLRVEGVSDATEVKAFGPACARTQADLDEIEIVTSISGDELLVETRFGSGLRERGSLDLTIQLPDSLPLEITDGSGSVRVSNVGGLRLDDGSGSIDVDDVHGDVRLDDGSGSITVRNVDGSVVVEDDGSGSIKISDVTGDVIIEEDGSGSIRVTDVQGDFRVLRDGSGSIRSDRIQGDTTTVP